MTPITQDDLLDAIRDALSRPTADNSGAHTMAELQLATGVGVGKLRAFLRTIHAEGRLEAVRVIRPTLAGAMAPVPAYRIKAK